MKIVFSLINSMTIALTISIYLFNWMWLQMRVNVGYIFLAFFILLFILFMFLSKKIADEKKFIYSILLFVVLFAINFIILGFAKLQIISAAIVRNAIMQTRIPFGTINTFIIIYYIVLLVLLFCFTKKQKK